MTWQAKPTSYRTQRRRRLLQAALTLEPQTVEQLATRLETKPATVYADLKVLELQLYDVSGVLSIDGGWVIV